MSFSPLAGIRYSETILIPLLRRELRSFSPLAGIRYSETLLVQKLEKVGFTGFSPLAGIRYSETNRLKDG